MIVYKFGGASVKNATAVRNVGNIVKSCNQPLIVVVSAMDKTTNLLEKLHQNYIAKKNTEDIYDAFVHFHLSIANEIFDQEAPVYANLNRHFNTLQKILETSPTEKSTSTYDSIVAFGELISTTIIDAYLNKIGIKSKWIDIREIIKTDSDGKRTIVNWSKSQETCDTLLKPEIQSNNVIVSQGFISSSSEFNTTTTLGREGSDYSAAILAYLLDAKEVCIWKDVPGMLNADPKYFNNTIKLDKISYREAIELSYYGASVIHPKTIKPLQNKNIPLYIKSFENPELAGTIIQKMEDYDSDIPSYIFKPKQMLLSFSCKDFSFIQEDNLSELFQYFNTLGLEINLMQNSALNFSVVTDVNEYLLEKLQLLVSQKYILKFNKILKLLTIRHYNTSILDELTKKHEVLLTQKTRNTIRIVLRKY